MKKIKEQTLTQHEWNQSLRNPTPHRNKKKYFRKEKHKNSCFSVIIIPIVLGIVKLSASTSIVVVSKTPCMSDITVRDHVPANVSLNVSSFTTVSSKEGVGCGVSS